MKIRVPFYLAIIGALAGCATPRPAAGFSHGALSVGNCPYGVDGGCAGANLNSVFLVSNAGGLPNGYGVSWQTDAMASGQSWTSSHPQTNNMAGVDTGYPVGYDKTLTLADPATASAGTGNGQMPTGCTYQATGGSGSTPRVYCTNAGSVTFSGFDMSLHGGVTMRLCGSSATTITIRDNYFKNGSSSDQVNYQFINSCTGSAINDNIIYNVFDGNYPSYHQMSNLVSLSTSGTSVIEYNAVLNAPNQVFNTGYNGASVTVNYNFVQGITVWPASGLHGAVDENLSNSTAGTGIVNQTEMYNTVVYPFGAPTTGTTAFSFLAIANAGYHYLTTGVVQGNTVVVNCTVTASTCSQNVTGTLATNATTTVALGAPSSNAWGPNEIISGPNIPASDYIVSQTSGTTGLAGNYVLSVAATGTGSGTATIHNYVSSAALTEPFTLGLISSLSVTNNYIDAHGASTCVQTLGNAYGGANNLYTNAMIDDGTNTGTAGHTLTVFSTAGQNIYPGAYLGGNGLSAVFEYDPGPPSGPYAPLVLPYGTTADGHATTGLGGVGTYAILYDTSPSTPGALLSALPFPWTSSHAGTIYGSLYFLSGNTGHDVLVVYYNTGTVTAGDVVSGGNVTGSPTIEAYGSSDCGVTSTGGGGSPSLGAPVTYCVASSSTTSQESGGGSVYFKTVTTPIAPTSTRGNTPTWTGNVNLEDGSTITLGGIQWNAGTCNGHAN